ncbi:hypothetical protein [Thalassolituus sp. UBA2009]|uniref:hypothetical protein n=1 Tax=Thalassolituus sp. UBA2009 TaxID=1947658 RepID=UPI00257ABB7E|nr:hypothetical protein [Thalassolituus sp. UBA2009]
MSHDTIGLRLAEELGIRPQQVAATVALLDEGATASINVTAQHGAIVLEKEGEAEICWPVSHNITSENGSYTLMACSPDNGGPDSFNYQLWY